MERRSDYITDMRRRLQDATNSCRSPKTSPKTSVAESTEAHRFSIGAGEWAAGMQQSSQEPVKVQQPRALHRAASPGDAGAGGEPAFVQPVAEPREAPMRWLPPPLLERGGEPVFVQPLAEPREAPMQVEEVATNVLRLRALKRQHDEFREQFSRAQHLLKRTPTHYFLLFQSYLEKHLCEPMLAAQLQQPFLQLIRGLAAACRLDAELPHSEALLACTRRLFRDAHDFASNLCQVQPLSPQEAKYLAPCLLSGQKYKRVREKEINTCFEALSEWLSALYFYSGVSDQVALVARELEEQEVLLFRLGGPSAMSKAGGASEGAMPPHPALAPTRMPSSSLNKSISASAVRGETVSRLPSSRRLSPGGARSPDVPRARAPPGTSSTVSRSASSHLGSLPGTVRRSSAGSPTNRLTRSPGNPGATRTDGGRSGVVGSVQRRQSDKALTQVLKAIKESRAASPETPVARPTGSSGHAPSAPSMLRTSSRKLMHGGLSTVPERTVSLPTTLLESLYGQPQTRAEAEPKASRSVQGVARRVTAAPRLQ